MILTIALKRHSSAKNRYDYKIITICNYAGSQKVAPYFQSIQSVCEVKIDKTMPVGYPLTHFMGTSVLRTQSTHRFLKKFTWPGGIGLEFYPLVLISQVIKWALSPSQAYCLSTGILHFEVPRGDELDVAGVVRKLASRLSLGTTSYSWMANFVLLAKAFSKAQCPVKKDATFHLVIRRSLTTHI